MEYANKIGADFICINEKGISRTTPHWEKFQISKLLNTYHRIIYFDSDIIIRNDCPNLFDIVPEDHIGLFNEAPFTNRSFELMMDVCNKYGVKLPNWDGKYYNTGVMVVSRRHIDMFQKPDQEIFSYYEQSYLNMIIALRKEREEIKVFELPYQFNRMTCMDFFTGEERFASHIIHYAGYPSLDFVLDLIPRDIARWEQDAPSYKYKSHILVVVSGGLGDQICAEPAIRYLKNNLMSDDDITVLTHFPEIFSHLGLPVYHHNEFAPKFDTPYYKMASLPGPETVTWSVVSNMLCNTVDFCSISMLKRTLPRIDKTICLPNYECDFSEITDYPIEDIVLLHAGKHWENKTLPKEWWQDLTDKLSNKGVKLGLIGKDEETRGVWDLICPENAVDFRNLLNIKQLICLISKAKMVISNDSAPIHIAGAFNNEIVLIPTCKHPDHVLPWRNGSQTYKATSIYKRLVIDDIKANPNTVYEVSGAEIPKEYSWDRYLFSSQETCDRIMGILNR